ncbi:hypothetical protein SRHO_G00005760 [Serrasalmus rhombeus]
MADRDLPITVIMQPYTLLDQIRRSRRGGRYGDVAGFKEKLSVFKRNGIRAQGLAAGEAVERMRFLRFLLISCPPSSISSSQKKPLVCGVCSEHGSERQQVLAGPRGRQREEEAEIRLTHHPLEDISTPGCGGEKDTMKAGKNTL